MRVLSFIILFNLVIISGASAQSDSFAILKLLATQTLEHQERLSELKNQVQILRQASEGLDGLEFATDFRKVIVKGDEFLNDIDGLIRQGKNFSEEWKNIFGDMDKIRSPGEVNTYETITLTDDINSDSYKMADKYQEAYVRNSQDISKLIANSGSVSTKGGIKQIAETLAHNLQLQNELIYLMSQDLKLKSLDSAQENVLRKEEVIRFKEENKAIRNFIGLANKGILLQ